MTNKYRKQQSNGSTITYNMDKTSGKNSITSFHFPSSYPSSKNVPSQNRRRSQFVRLDFGGALKLTSKQSTNSVHQQNTLRSIKEHPSEDNNFDIAGSIKKSMFSCFYF